MIKHTPGPWSVEINRESNILDSAGNRVAVACQTCWPDEGTDRIDDNARLIAAAPELLAALQALMALDVKGHALADRLQFSDSGRALLDQCRAALLKVTT